MHKDFQDISSKFGKIYIYAIVIFSFFGIIFSTVFFVYDIVYHYFIGSENILFSNNVMPIIIFSIFFISFKKVTNGLVDAKINYQDDILQLDKFQQSIKDVKSVKQIIIFTINIIEIRTKQHLIFRYIPKNFLSLIPFWKYRIPQDPDALELFECCKQLLCKKKPQ